MKQTTQQKTQVNKRKPNKYMGLKNLDDSYKHYEEDYPKSHLDKAMYKKVCITFFKECVNYLLEGCEVKLPFMGLLKVVKRKRDFNKLHPDWKRTNELWEKDPIAKEKKQLVYHLNEHSGGHYFRFYWKKGMVKNISAYSFLPVRGVKSALATAVKEGNKDFI